MAVASSRSAGAGCPSHFVRPDATVIVWRILRVVWRGSRPICRGHPSNTAKGKELVWSLQDHGRQLPNERRPFRERNAGCSFAGPYAMRDWLSISSARRIKAKLASCGGTISSGSRASSLPRQCWQVSSRPRCSTRIRRQRPQVGQSCMKYVPFVISKSPWLVMSDRIITWPEGVTNNAWEVGGKK